MLFLFYVFFRIFVFLFVFFLNVNVFKSHSIDGLMFGTELMFIFFLNFFVRHFMYLCKIYNMYLINICCVDAFTINSIEFKFGKIYFDSLTVTAPTPDIPM